MPITHGSGNRFRIVLLSAIALLLTGVPYLYAEENSDIIHIHENDPSENSEPEITPVETERYGTARVGYRFLNSDGVGTAASPYTRLKSGAMLGLSAGSIGTDQKLSGAATVINEDDYHAEMLFDGGGAYHFHLESQALWHNLILEQQPPATPGYTAVQNLSPGENPGLRVSTHQADAKIRLGSNPMHLTLGYWELHREGNIQTRFSDFSFSPAASTIVSKISKKDQTTREGTLGVDGQLGSLGVAYTFRIRDFSDQSPVNRYNFSNTASGATIPGNHAFSVTPDNQTVSHSIKLYSDMSGGLTGTASYTYMQRENNGNGGDAIPSSQPHDTVQAASGDLRYTPFKELSFALKYRHQQIDRQSPATITTPFLTIPTSGTVPATMNPATPGLLLVHPSSDSTRDTVVLSTAYQPSAAAQLRFEYRAELESRSDLQYQQAPNDPSLRGSDSRQTHTGKVTAIWKPVNGIRMTALYSYADCDNPAYSNSFSRQHTGQFFATINRSKRWGGTASYLGRYETSDTSAIVTVTNTKIPLSRENLNNSVNASIWFSPFNRMTITTSYSYLANDSDQAVLFSSNSAGSLAATNYNATAHLYSIDAVYALSQQIDLGMSFQQIYSNSRFNVGRTQFTDPATSILYSTSGITDLTALDARESGIVARTDWRITSRYGLSLEYGFRNYDSGNSLFDGSTHSIMTLVTGHW